MFRNYPGIFDFKIDTISISSISLLAFTTNASTLVFDPTFAVSSGTLNWNLGDGSTSVDLNNFIHTYTTVGNKAVKVYAGTTTGASAITSINMNTDDLVGILDISSLFNLGGIFYVFGNPNLTQILNPVSSQVFTSYWAYDCSLNGTLDISGLTGLGGNLQIYTNPNLTQILNPVSSQAFTEYGADTCNLTGILDMSGLTGLGGSFYVFNNPNLTRIVNPNSSQILGYYSAKNCNLTGTLDVSCLTGLEGSFFITDNPNLTELTLPTTLAGQFIFFEAKNCSLNIASIDAALLKLQTLYDASTPVANLVVNFDGTGNSWPTDGIDNRYSVKIQNTFDVSTIYDVSMNLIPEPMDASINALHFNNSAYVVFNSIPDISTFGLPITFNAYLDTSLYSFNILAHIDNSIGENMNNFTVFLDSNYLNFQFGAVDSCANGRINIKTLNLAQKNLAIEVGHSIGTTSRKLEYVKINGTPQTIAYDITAQGGSVVGLYVGFCIGALETTPNNFVIKGNNSAIWNFRIPRRGKWKGYPDGSTNAAWTDRIGTNDGSIVGTATTIHLITP